MDGLGEEVTLTVTVPAAVKAGLCALAARAGIDEPEAYVGGLLAALVAAAQTDAEAEDQLRQVQELEARLRSLGYID